MGYRLSPGTLYPMLHPVATSSDRSHRSTCIPDNPASLKMCCTRHIVDGLRTQRLAMKRKGYP